MYGTQTEIDSFVMLTPFENDVKMYGTQTKKAGGMCGKGLRMM